MSHTAVLNENAPAPTSEELCLRARQQAVVLAYARRSQTQRDTRALMQEAVDLIAETLKVELNGIALPVHEGIELSLVPVSDQAHALASVHTFSLDDPSMLTFALDARKAVASDDLAAEIEFLDPLLQEIGIAAAITVPLATARATHGALGLYCTAPRKFTNQDIAFAETIGHLLTLTIERIAAEQAVDHRRSLLDVLMNHLAAAVITVNPSGVATELSAEAARLSGYRIDELQARPFWESLVPAPEQNAAEACFRKAAAGKPAGRLENWLTAKDGQRRRMLWQFADIRSGDIQNGEDRITAVVLTGLDITDRRRAEQWARQWQSKAVNASRSLGQLVSRIKQTKPKAAIPTGKGDSATATTASDKRGSPRAEYPFQQRIAPMRDEVMPTEKDFREVKFRDISSGGASFVIEGDVDFQTVVIELGAGHEHRYVSAQVIRVDPVAGNDNAHLVACQLTGKIEL